MSDTYEIKEKLVDLSESIVDAGTFYTDISIKKGKQIGTYKAIQIILTTSTTILLGLKLGGISTSLAFILSTIATSLTIWYNIEAKSEEYTSAYRYRMHLISLAREILFYVKTEKELEETKYQEYLKMFYDLQRDFGKESLSLVEKSLKKDKDTMKSFK